MKKTHIPKSEIKKLSSEINILIESHDSIFSEAKTLHKKIEKNIKSVSAKNDLISTYKKSISLESELKIYPHQAIGSVGLAKKFNEKNENFPTAFDNEQEKGITRFIMFIEGVEGTYRNYYINIAETYLSDPKSQGINDMILLNKTFTALSNFYILLKTLIKESNGDIVLFNKAYITLEDRGMFMSFPEKEQLSILKELVESHYKIIDAIQSIDIKLVQIGDNIRDSYDVLQDMNTELFCINQSVMDVDYSIMKYSN